jgi:hypothetical protein
MDLFKKKWIRLFNSICFCANHEIFQFYSYCHLILQFIFHPQFQFFTKQ